MKRRFFLGLLSALFLASTGICSPPNLDFSGTWKLSSERSTPKRTGSVTLHIEHRDPDLIVETAALRNSGPPRYAVQRYTTDGKTSVSIGNDGDEFHTSIVWNGPCLVFSVEEHEDGRIILSKETWTLIDNGAALQRVRNGLNASPDKAERQTLIYLRQLPQT
ncbi:hypothetical protein RBB79_02135 [Tunturiibacter empetritectus]|uniref:Lipocalin-like domain-containing protein n=2 Tax=Tunturiibacter TaxID=3154218 RepID=A0A852VDE6_9BACT|nr:hypothetical protein [Edaphobacter lichenicola]NYF88295.1 hypothetical protein [Edaphobacter lichenicola]